MTKAKPTLKTKRTKSVTHKIPVHHALPAVAVSIIGGVLIGAMILGYIGSTGAPVGISMLNPTRQAKLGQQLRFGNLAVKIDGLRLDGIGEQPYFPGTDRQFVVVNLTAKNNGKVATWTAPVGQAVIIDKSGNRYYLAPAPVNNPYDAGPVGAGEARTGEISFNVPKSASGLKLYFVPVDKGVSIAAYDLGI
jgi:hypothetical protein